MVDREIICKTCQTVFVWTAGEQEFYKEKGLNEPRNCRNCREKKKAARERKGGRRE